MIVKKSKYMEAVVYHGPGNIRVEHVPIPEINKDEALIEVVGAGICGTDLRILHGGHRKLAGDIERILGHEVVGSVVEVGENVESLTEGEQVFIAPNIGCGHCRQCIKGNPNLCPDYSAIGITVDGAFAEYLRIPSGAIRQGNILPVDKATASEAALIEPLACVIRGQDAVNIQPADILLVVGAGPIGLMHMMLGRIQGVQCVIVSEKNSERCKKAKKLGADIVVDPLEEDLKGIVMEESGGEGADVIIIAAPAHEAQEGSLELACKGGRINFFGGLPKDNSLINFNSNLVHYKELIVTGTTASNNENCRRAAKLVTSKRIDLTKLVSESFPLMEARKAFEIAEERKSLKIVFEPQKK